MKFTVLFLLVFCFVNPCFSQPTPQIHLATPFVYTKQVLKDKSVIEQDIVGNGNKIDQMTNAWVESQLIRIQQYNDSIDAEIDNINNISHRWNRNLHSLKEIAASLPNLRRRIEEGLNNRIDFEKQFEKEIIKQTRTKGLYLVVVPLGDDNYKRGSDYYKRKALVDLSSKAVKELNGVFIESVTSVIDQSSVRQSIKSKSKGQMEKSITVFEKRRSVSGDYIFLFYVDVVPLDSVSQGSVLVEADSVVAEMKMVSCQNPDLVNELLSGLKFSSEDEMEVKQKIGEYLGRANKYNETNKKNIENSWSEFKSNITGIDNQIEADRKTEKVQVKQLQLLVTDAFPGGMEVADLNDSLLRVHSHLKSQQRKISEYRQHLESGKVISSDRKIINVTTGDPPGEAIANAIFTNVAHIDKEAGSEIVYSEEVLVEDKEVSDASALKSESFRTINTVWAFITPTDNSQFFLTLVYRFDLTGVRDTSVKYSIHCKSANGGTCSPKGEYSYNSLARIVAVPADGYEFAGWYDNSKLVTDSNPYSFKVTDDRYLTAIFKKIIPKYNLTLDAKSFGNTVILKGGGLYEDGSLVPVSIQMTSSRYSFDGWYDEKNVLVSKELTIVVKMSGKDRIINARVSRSPLMPNASISRYTTRHNDYENGVQGMSVTIYFSVVNMKDYMGKIRIFVYCDDPSCVGKSYGDKLQSYEVSYAPGYDNTLYNKGIRVFMPYPDLLQYAKRDNRTNFKYTFQIEDETENYLAGIENVQFYLDR